MSWSSASSSSTVPPPTSPATSASWRAIWDSRRRVGKGAFFTRRAHHLRVQNMDGGHVTDASASGAFAHPTRSLRRHVFAVLYREQNAGAVVEAVAVLFGEVVDALTGRQFLFAHQRLADRFAEFRRAGLCRLQRHGHDA